jgi:hypothetical protein
MRDKLNPLYIFALHEASDESDSRRLIRIVNIEGISHKLIIDIIKALNFKHFRTAFFKSKELRNCFLGNGYIAATLQIRGKVGIPIKTIENLLKLHKKLYKLDDNFATEIAEKILLNGYFYAGPFGHKVKLPLCITEELAFLSGVIAGDGTINAQAIRVSDGFELSKKNLDIGNERKLIQEDMKLLKNLFRQIFGCNPTDLSCYSENYEGIVIQSKPIIRFFIKVLGHPIHSKNYEEKVWNPDKLKIPELIKNSSDKLFLSYLRGLFCTDGTISSRDYRLDSISNIVYEIGDEIKKRFRVQVYFNSRPSTSRGKIVKDKLGNVVMRNTLILKDKVFLNMLFSGLYIYPSKRADYQRVILID